MSEIAARTANRGYGSNPCYRSAIVEIYIRLAQTQEIDAIVELQNLALARSPDRYRRSDRYQIAALVCSQADARRAAQAEETIIVATTDRQELVGFAAISTTQSIIVGIFVHPQWQSKGIGTRLLRELEQIAIASKTPTLSVMSSIEAIDFYKRNGYTAWEATGFYANEHTWIPCLMLDKELIKRSRLAIAGNKIILTLGISILLVFCQQYYRSHPTIIPPSESGEIRN